LKTTQHKSSLNKQIGNDLPIVVDEKTGNQLFFSRREILQRYIIPVSRISKFYEGLAEGKMYATRCRRCGKLYFPPAADCSSCMSSSTSYIELSRKAKLIAYTIVSVKPSSFANVNDYIVAIGRLKEGLNVLSWLVGVEPRDIRIGMELELNVGKIKDDNVLTYFFTHAKSRRKN